MCQNVPLFAFFEALSKADSILVTFGDFLGKLNFHHFVPPRGQSVQFLSVANILTWGFSERSDPTKPKFYAWWRFPRNMERFSCMKVSVFELANLKSHRNVDGQRVAKGRGGRWTSSSYYRCSASLSSAVYHSCSASLFELLPLLCESLTRRTQDIMVCRQDEGHSGPA